MNSIFRLIKLNFLLVIILVIISVPAIIGIDIKLLTGFYAIAVILTTSLSAIGITSILNLQMKVIPIYIAMGLVSIIFGNGFIFLITLIFKISYFLLLSMLVQESFGYLAEHPDLVENNSFLRFYSYLTTFFIMIKKNIEKYSFRDYFSISGFVDLFTNCLDNASEITIKKKTPKVFEVRIFINNILLIFLSLITIFIRILKLQ